MASLNRKVVLLFIACFFAIALPLCLFPINLFSGEIVYKSGLQEAVIQAPLSLSYFFGLGYDPADMVGVQDFYLTGSGYLTAFIFLIGIPGLVAYRVYLSGTKKKQ